MKSGQVNLKWAKLLIEISHQKRNWSTQGSVYLYEPYFLFSVFWHIFYFLYSDLAATRGTGPPKDHQFLDSVNNSPVVPFKDKPASPEPIPTTSSGSLCTCLTSCATYQTTRDHPYSSEPAGIILTSPSETCLPCPACFFLQKPQQRLFPSCSFLLCLLTNLGAFLCGHLWQRCTLSTCLLWVTKYLFNGNNLLIWCSYYMPSFLLMLYIVKQHLYQWSEKCKLKSQQYWQR